MKKGTVIFDMDGLLIDSEPLWETAGAELLHEYDIDLTPEQYQGSTGLRTKEWVAHWFNHFNIKTQHTDDAVARIIKKAIEKIGTDGIAMPGVPEIFELLKQADVTMAIATSSPLSLVDIVVDKLNIRQYLQCMVSAESLQYGKPHPEVYLNCALQLGIAPVQCICFEDSFNGMIAVKAARMKCVVVPAVNLQHLNKWDAADLRLSSLLDFGQRELNMLLQ